MSNGDNGATHQVAIQVASNGDIQYEWAVLHVRRQDKIVWTFEGELTVLFPQTPFDDGQLALYGAKGAGTTYKATSTPFAKDARGVYRYHVALRPALKAPGEAASRIFLDVGCPEIIVGR